MRRDDRVIDIIAAAAETTTLSEVGSEVIPRLQALLGAGRFLLYHCRADQPFHPVAGMADCLPEYAARFAADDPLQRYMRRENPTLFAGSRCREWQEMRCNSALVDFYSRFDLSWLFHMRLSDTQHMEPGHVGLILGRDGRAGDFAEDDVRAVNAVVPSLAAAVRRAGKMAQRLSTAAAIEALFARGQSRSVLAMDLRAKVLWLSAAAEQALGAQLRSGRALAEVLQSLATRFSALVRRDPLFGTAPFAVSVPMPGEAPLLAEAYLSLGADGEPFIIVDFGGNEAPLCVHEIAQRYKLTRAETEVLSDLVCGCSDADIASRRFVSNPTVRTHVTRVLAKLRVKSRLEAVALALGTSPKRH